MKKKVYLFLIITSLVFLIVGFAILIFNISKIDKKTETSNRKLPESNFNQNVISTNASEPRISPNATITKIYTYKKCGHTISTSETIQSSLVNISEGDFKKVYSEWELVDFSADLVKISKDCAGNCPEHFLVKDLNGYVAIYHVNDDSDFTLLETTGIVTKYLSQIDMNELESGVFIYGKEKLNSYIEDFE